MLLPLAVAVGVLVGRGGSNDNAALLALLRNQKPIVVNAAARRHRAGGRRRRRRRVGEHPPEQRHLGTGFVVKLQTLPTAGTTEATRVAAESAATAKGAAALGLINPATTQDVSRSGPADYVIYSGFYTSRSAATAAARPAEGPLPDRRGDRGRPGQRRPRAARRRRERRIGPLAHRGRYPAQADGRAG